MGNFVVVSLLVHLHVVLLAMSGIFPESCNRHAPDFAPLEVDLVPASAASADKAIKELEEAERQRERDPKGQVVELPPPIEEKRPDKAKYLSEYDSTVAKEQKARARQRASGKPRVGSARSQRQPRQHAQPQRRAKAQQRPAKRMRLAMRQPVRTPRSRLPESVVGESARQPRPSGGATAKAGQGNAAQELSRRLQLTEAELARVVGSRVNDALQDVEEGEQTLLNSKRWLYASFFNRVKRRVSENWHPDRAYLRRDPSGNVYGFRDRLTILRVRLNPAGKLKDVHVEKASGVGFLDDEAIAAFRAAEPFPNPPRGLVDRGSGLISFRFGFLFELSRRPTFRLFRYRD